MKTLEGRVAVVTGAGSGIGRATSELLAREGCTLALVDVDVAGLKLGAESIGRLGRDVSTHVVDVSSRAAMQQLAEEVVDTHAGVHLLVNNAGINIVGDFSGQSLEDFERIVGINLWGVIHGCKFFLPHLLASEEGHLVNVSSTAGFALAPRMSSYTTTKFAVRGLTESLRQELAATRVGVTCVYPGMIKTNITQATEWVGDDVSEMRDKSLKLFERFARSPDYAARCIVRGIRKNAARVLIGPDAHILERLKRLFPSWTDRLLSSVT